MTGHIRRRGDRSWEIKFDLGTDPVTGKRLTRYASVKGTKKAAEKELTRILAAIDDGLYIEPTKISVADYLERWLTDDVKHQVSAKTHERYAEIVRKHLVPALGAHRLAKLAPLHLQAYYGAAVATGRVRELAGGIRVAMPPLAARTVKHHHRVLSQALKRAIRLRLLVRNPCDDVDPPRPKRTEMKIIDQARTGELLKAAEGSALYIPVLIAVTTGMRRGEVLALHWRDVDLDAAIVHVTLTLEQTKNGLAFKEPKTERSRRAIALPALTVEALRRHRVSQAEAFLRLGHRQNDTLVCCDPTAQPLSPRAVTKAFGTLSARLKLGIRFHDLRHSHISHLLAAGVHPKVASERAGHASVSITLDVYSHLMPGMQEDAAMKIDAALRTHLER